MSQTDVDEVLDELFTSPQPSDLLDEIEYFLSRFISYPSRAALTAHVLWIVHTWFMDRWDSTPRLAFLSPEPGSGKTRGLEVSEPLVPHSVHAVNTTPAYLFRKVSDPEGLPTILYDEIDTVFGPKAKDNEDVRGMLNAGHRKGATAGRCVVKGKIVETEELPAYCAVALAGLNDLPDTIMSRSIVVRMQRRAPGEKVEPWRNRINRPEAEPIAAQLAALAASVPELPWPVMPEQIQDRNADLWEPLLAVADLAGPAWAEKARVAAVALVADSMAGQPSIGVLLLRDLRAVFAGRDKMPTEALLEALHHMEESPWGDLRGKPVDSRWLSRQLKKYGVQPKVIRMGERATPRGYEASDLADPWQRYLPALTGPADPHSVAAVADVADSWAAIPSAVAHQEAPIGKLRERDHTPIKGQETPPSGAVGMAAYRSATSATVQQVDPQLPLPDSSEPALCAACDQPMDAYLASLGEVTHPSCGAAA